MRIIGFTGYNNGTQIVIKGRIISQEYHVPQKESSWWKNLRSNISRLLAQAIHKQEVIVTFGKQKREVRTNKRGFFEAKFTTEKKGWQQATIIANKEQATIDVLCSTNKKGIISDVDDTFLTTHTAHFFKKIRLFFLKNAKTREAVIGMPLFYRKTNRQLFYVSSSSWELYDFIREFCETQNMPKGPYLLSPNRVVVLRRNHHDKERRIQDILKGYSNTRFILVGDDAQKDPLIYKNIAKKYPGRIEAIFIRSIKNKEKTTKQLEGCAQPYFVETSAKKLHKHYLTLNEVN